MRAREQERGNTRRERKREERHGEKERERIKKWRD